MTQKKPCPCGKPGLSIQVAGMTLCQEHFNAFMDETHPKCEEAFKLLGMSPKRGS